MLSLLLILLAGFAALMFLVSLQKTKNENELVRKHIAEMRIEVDRLLNEGEKVQQQLSPQQRETLIAAHKLVANKSFGWSRLFADIESVIPGGVSASRISVENVFRDNDRIKAELDFTVINRDYQSVMSMINAMNNSGVFQAELRSQNMQTTQRISYSEFTLKLIYTPAYGYAQTDVAQTAIEEGGDN